MDDETSFTMKLMLLMTIKTVKLQLPGGTKNDICRVPVGLDVPSNYKSVG